MFNIGITLGTYLSPFWYVMLQKHDVLLLESPADSIITHKYVNIIRLEVYM